jgi:glycosyltransferase involved in cell wall biosynthesis
MDQPSTLIILIPGFAKNETDTSCIPLAQSFIRTINHNFPGIEVTVIAIDYPFTSTAYNWFGNRVIPLNGTVHRFRPLLWWKIYSLLRKLSHQQKPPGILSFWHGDHAMIAHFFAKRNSIAHLTWLQGQDARKRKKLHLLYHPAEQQLVALSDFLQTEFARNYHIKPAHIVYPGIKAASYQNNAGKDIDILGVGSLVALKQYQVFISVIAKLKTTRPGISAMLVGDGPERLKLEKLIKENNLEQNIVVAGTMGHPQVQQVMSRSKILLHPSAYEGYSMACLEALSAGCHVVSFVSAEKKSIQHWDIVDTEDMMVEKCSGILKLPEEAFYPVVPHTMDECVKNMLHLFGYLDSSFLTVQQPPPVQDEIPATQLL